MKPDTVISIQPYFKIHQGKRDDFASSFADFVNKSKTEENMVFYNFAVKDDVVFCREGYKDGESVLAHLANVDELFKKALTMSDLIKLEVCGPPSELEKVKEALTPLGAEFWALESVGVRH
ncbi:MAG: hypothetical protein SGILL_003070 [Bacillariaceae sp.]